MLSLTDFKRESYFQENARLGYKFENCPKQKVQDCKWFHKSTSRCISSPFLPSGEKRAQVVFY